MSETLRKQTVKQQLAARAEAVEDYLRGCLKGRGIPCSLLQAMEYSLNAGGKRVRPVLCLSAAGLFGLEGESVLPFAGALECIHTYSLIHDDLPAMDDDDLRRGKPSNHKMFGEAMAILAGDGLLTEAFVFMASVAGSIPAERVLPALEEIAMAAGSSGMVGGAGPGYALYRQRRRESAYAARDARPKDRRLDHQRLRQRRHIGRSAPG